ncbi:RNA polymerase sigma factor [Paenibacillus segetis]|uniref:DNA-directed RNA polymerase sigma-70 factor n=1 Tax=Paenibacillus segetis TaxID=1325360 RepID=A0ABQ1YB02_9BACL|nr:sigma-70 family RNA polymerase sigma factor [Paenibacillus segetis]GGH19405.1 DNA-directed RNA polymerase sigma-70 factor [Paenibacillus segetis]
MRKNSLLRTDRELGEIYRRNVDTVYRLCYMYLKNSADAEDAVQSIFLKLIKSSPIFSDHEHEKAWFIVLTQNHCKDILKSWWKTRRIDLTALPEVSCWDDCEQSGEVLERLLTLPNKYKIVLYLYYFEDYSVKEISNMLKRKVSTIQTQLATGRKLLKMNLVDRTQDNYVINLRTRDKTVEN